MGSGVNSETGYRLAFSLLCYIFSTTTTPFQASRHRYDLTPYAGREESNGREAFRTWSAFSGVLILLLFRFLLIGVSLHRLFSY